MDIDSPVFHGVQGPAYTWFGYPQPTVMEDPVRVALDMFVPGLPKTPTLATTPALVPSTDGGDSGEDGASGELVVIAPPSTPLSSSSGPHAHTRMLTNTSENATPPSPAHANPPVDSTFLLPGGYQPPTGASRQEWGRGDPAHRDASGSASKRGPPVASLTQARAKWYPSAKPEIQEVARVAEMPPVNSPNRPWWDFLESLGGIVAGARSGRSSHGSNTGSSGTVTTARNSVNFPSRRTAPGIGLSSDAGWVRIDQTTEADRIKMRRIKRRRARLASRAATLASATKESPAGSTATTGTSTRGVDQAHQTDTQLSHTVSTDRDVSSLSSSYSDSALSVKDRAQRTDASNATGPVGSNPEDKDTSKAVTTLNSSHSSIRRRLDALPMIEKAIVQSVPDVRKRIESLYAWLSSQRLPGRPTAAAPSRPSERAAKSTRMREANPKFRRIRDKGHADDSIPHSPYRRRSSGKKKRVRGDFPATETSLSVSRSGATMPLSQTQQKILAMATKILQRIPMPVVEISDVTLKSGALHYTVLTESHERTLHNLSGVVRVGKGFHTLGIDLKAQPGTRDPVFTKTTTVMPTSKRHLRFTLPTADLQMPFSFRKKIPTLPHAKEAPPPAPSLPGEGSIDMKLFINNISVAGTTPDLTVRIRGKNLTGPMIERVIELPMDIHRGRVSGELTIRSEDDESWLFPLLYGKVNVEDADFHFWDASDDITDASMELHFEGKQLYFHKASGKYGAIPIRLSGDMDLNPDLGQYRLSAESDGVELNALRCTLGVRPTPFPLAGAAKGIVHVTGPLEKPVFSGTAVGIPPTPTMRQESPASWAQTSLETDPSAVAAYDKVSFKRASVVFTVDTATEMAYMHAIHAEPFDGGHLNASGRMWVAPEAEDHPEAILVHVEATDVPADALAIRYMSLGGSLPPSIHMGDVNAKAVMYGSHLAPTIDVDWEAPRTHASGHVKIEQDITMDFKSPNVDFRGTVEMKKLGKDIATAAVTPDESYWAAQPLPVRADLHVNLNNLDVSPLVQDSPPTAQDRLKTNKLKLSGDIHVSGDITYQAPPVNVSGKDVLPEQWEDVSHEELLERSIRVVPAITHLQPYNLPGVIPDMPDEKHARLVATERAFNAKLSARTSFQGVRLNQLGIARNMKGALTASTKGIRIDANGQRGDENICLILGPGWLGQGDVIEVKGDEVVDTGAAVETVEAVAEGPSLGRFRFTRISDNLFGGDGVDVVTLPFPSFVRKTPGYDTTSTRDDDDIVDREMAENDLGTLTLTQGKLRVDASMNSSGSGVNLMMKNLNLDKLEMASLRGQVEELGINLDFHKKLGRGNLTISRPKFSGLLGESLSGSLRWERNILRLERSILRQRRSLYEVNGEYIIPASTPFPESAFDVKIGAEMLSRPKIGQEHGLWRWEIVVPGAQLEEILPAARIVSDAASETPIDYEKAKAHLLEGLLTDSLIIAEDLRAQIALQRRKGKLEAGSTSDRADSCHGNLPGLQDLEGHWSGRITAYGGADAATAVGYELQGDSWSWGQFSLDSAIARGRYHSVEGWEVDEMSLNADKAKFNLSGTLLSPDQDAEFSVEDMPAEWIKPMISMAPKLLDASRGEEADVSREDAEKGPVTGSLWMNGKLRGTSEEPQGEIGIKLLDGSIRGVPLKVAHASANVDKDQRLSFFMRAAPKDTPGHIHAEGNLPLKQRETSDYEELMYQITAPMQRLTGITRRQPDAIDIEAQVKDSGMALLTALLPDVVWHDGEANISVAAKGTLRKPEISGSAVIKDGMLKSPFIKGDLEALQATMVFKNDTLYVAEVSARTGREKGRLSIFSPKSGRGSLSVQGELPLISNSPWSPKDSGIVFTVKDMPLTTKNVSGMIFADVKLSGSAVRPVISGDITATRGTLTLSPQSGGSVGFDSVFESEKESLQSTLAASFLDQLSRNTEKVSKVPIIPKDSVSNVRLSDLRLRLGPELSAQFPLVLRMQLGGEIVLNGVASPTQIKPSGSIVLEGGEVNLVATQLSVDREHNNVIAFVEDQGLDPNLDICFRDESNHLVYAVQGKASRWQESILLNTGETDGSDRLDPKKAAQLFAKQLESTLFRGDGQLAMPSLVPTAYSLAPRIEVRGEIGKARYRVHTMALLPEWFSLDPGKGSTSAGMSSILSAINSEVEISYGGRLLLAVSRRPLESQSQMQYTLQWNFSPKLRLLCDSGTQSAPRITLQYQGDGRTSAFL